MRRLALGLGLFALLVAAGGCDDETVSPSPPQPADVTGPDGTAADGTSDGTGADAADDTGVTGDTADVGDAEETSPPTPTLRCLIRLRTGTSPFGPPAAVTLSVADEPNSYAASPGFQVDFIAETRNVVQGQPSRLVINGAAFGGPKNVVVNGDVGEAQFLNVTVPGGVTLVTLEVDTRAGTTLSCTPTQFTLDTPTCGAQLLPTAETCAQVDAAPGMPGFQVRFTVKNPDKSCDRARVRWTVGGVETLSDPIPLTADGAADVLVTVSDQSALDGLQVTASAVVEDSGDASRQGESAPATYTVDSTAPVVQILSPVAKLIGLDDDANQDPSDGIQVVVTGTVEGLAPGGDLQVQASGQTAVAAQITGATPPYDWQATIDFAASGVYQVTATGTDACGNGDTAAIVGLTVSTTRAALSILTPSDGAVLLAKDSGPGGDTLVYDTTFVVAADPIEPPVRLSILCGDAAPGAPDPVVVGSLLVDAASGDGSYVVPVLIDISGGGAIRRCHVRDDAVNPSESTAVELTIGLPAPILVIGSPADDLVTNETVVAVSGAATHLAGQYGRLTLNTQAGVTVYGDVLAGPFIGAESFAFNAWLRADGTQTGTPVPDGRYVLTVDALDDVGNAASATPGSKTTLALRKDTTAPTLVLVQPQSGPLDPMAVPDSSPNPGYQAQVVVAVSDGGFEAGVQVCLSLDGDPVACAAVPVGSTAVAFPAVTLQPGPNTLTVTGTDDAGNVAAPVSATPDLQLDVPAVKVVSPAGGLVTAFDVFDLVARVTAPGGAPALGATVSLLADGQPVTAVAADGGDGLYTFTGVPIPGTGTYSFVVRAEVDGATGFSAPVAVTKKIDLPSIAFVSALQGAQLTKASPLCSAGKADCELTVTCDTLNVEAGSPATLTVDCGGGATSKGAQVIGNKATFAGVLLANNATCTLECSVTDLAGQTATSGPNTLTVDRTAPILSLFLKPGADLHRRRVGGGGLPVHGRPAGLGAGGRAEGHGERHGGERRAADAGANARRRDPGRYAPDRDATSGDVPAGDRDVPGHRDRRDRQPRRTALQDRGDHQRAADRAALPARLHRAQGVRDRRRLLRPGDLLGRRLHTALEQLVPEVLPGGHQRRAHHAATEPAHLLQRRQRARGRPRLRHGRIQGGRHHHQHHRHQGRDAVHDPGRAPRVHRGGAGRRTGCMDQLAGDRPGDLPEGPGDHRHGDPSGELAGRHQRRLPGRREALWQ